MRYNHTQPGYLIIMVTILLLIYFGFVFIISGYNYIVLITTIIILLIMLSFATLNVRIDQQYLKVKFGYGLYKKKFPLKDIVSAKTVKNHWYYGWGVRWWMGTWIYNVSGFDAVEIKLKNEKTYRIGTDEPKKLETAINGLQKRTK